MGRYRIELKKSVLKDFDSIPRKDLQRIIVAIQALADDPRPAQSKKLSGLEQYRLRQGDYRILYTIEDAVLIVLWSTAPRTPYPSAVPGS
jgi:mRNA interferase RelE/StbE